MLYLISLCVSWTLSKILRDSVFNLQEGEKIQPEIVEEANDALVQELSAMGFPIENCRKALLATGNKGKTLVTKCIDPFVDEKILNSFHAHADLEPAMEYLLGDNISKAAGMYFEIRTSV